MPANNILDEQETDKNDINELINTSTPFDYNAIDLTQEWKPSNNDETSTASTASTISHDDNDTITDDDFDEYKYENIDDKYDQYSYDEDVIGLTEIIEKALFREWKKQAIKYTFCRNEYKFPEWPQGTFPQIEDFLATDFKSAMKHEKVRKAFGERVGFHYNGNLENDKCDIDDIMDSGKKKKHRKKHHHSSRSSSSRSSKHRKSSSSSKYKKSSSSSSRRTSTSSSSSSRPTSKTSSSRSSHSKSISNKYKTSKSSSSSSSGSKRVDIKTKSHSSSSSKQRASSSSSKKIRTESKTKSISKSNSNSKSKQISKSKSKISASTSASKSKSKLKIKAVPTITHINNALNGVITQQINHNNAYGYNYNYFPNLNNININNSNNGYGGGYWDVYGNFIPCDPYNNQAVHEYHQYYQQQQCHLNNNNHYQQFYHNQDIADPMGYFPINTKLPDIAENTNAPNDSSSVPSHLSYSNSRNEAALNL